MPVNETPAAKQGDFTCPISLEEMKDPVVLVPSGISYDRKSICASLLRSPTLDPKTNVRYSEPLDYCDNVDLRLHLAHYERYDDSEFRRMYRGVKDVWYRDRVPEANIRPVPVSNSLSERYERIHAFMLGLNRVQVDYEKALELAETVPNDPVLIAMRAEVYDELGETRKEKKLWKSAVEKGLLQAAESGCRFAQVYTGTIYWDGKGGKRKNLEKARYWFEKAAAQGDPCGQCCLGLIHEEYVRGKKKDLSKARELYEMAAAQGHAVAQFLIGSLLLSHPEFLNYEESDEWLNKAATQGLHLAQYVMGVMYESGWSGNKTPDDYEKARSWYEKAAAQKNVRAQFLLANLYRGGFVGNGNDYQKARELYEQAAAKGHLRAKGRLALLKVGTWFLKV